MWHAVVASSASRLSAPESGLGIGGHLALASGVCANRAPRFPCVNGQLPRGSDDKSLASTCLDPASPPNRQHRAMHGPVFCEPPGIFTPPRRGSPPEALPQAGPGAASPSARPRRWRYPRRRPPFLQPTTSIQHRACLGDTVLPPRRRPATATRLPTGNFLIQAAARVVPKDQAPEVCWIQS